MPRSACLVYDVVEAKTSIVLLVGSPMDTSWQGNSNVSSLYILMKMPQSDIQLMILMMSYQETS